MATLDNDDLKAIKSLIEVTIDEAIDRNKFVAKSDLSPLPTKDDFYGKMDEVVGEQKNEKNKRCNVSTSLNTKTELKKSKTSLAHLQISSVFSLMTYSLPISNVSVQIALDWGVENLKRIRQSSSFFSNKFWFDGTGLNQERRLKTLNPRRLRAVLDGQLVLPTNVQPAEPPSHKMYRSCAGP